MGISAEKVREAIRKNPHARAVFIINPTYYGMASDIKSIIRTAHMHDIPVIADEAHGAHMMFRDDFPLTAMEAGADMSAVSVHKTAGSLTQSSVLLSGGALIPKERIRQSLSLTFTSSASYLLMCSLDIARKQLPKEQNCWGKVLTCQMGQRKQQIPVFTPLDVNQDRTGVLILMRRSSEQCKANRLYRLSGRSSGRQVQHTGRDADLYNILP